MTQALDYPGGWPQPADAASAEAVYAPRRPVAVCFTMFWTLLALLSWMAGGIGIVTDMAWIGMTITCIAFVIAELVRFPRRLGIGGMVIFGGLILWFGMDYFKYWSGFAEPASLSGVGAGDLVPGDRETDFLTAKATFYTFLFFAFMHVGLLIRAGGWLPRLIASIPQPRHSGAMFGLILALFIFGLLPYFLFTNDPWYIAIYKDVVGMRSGGAQWTVGRTGTINFDWGGYVAQWLQIGSFAGLLAAFHAIFMAADPLTRLLCWVMYAYSFAYAFGTGSRGEVVYFTAPVAAMFFIKYQVSMLGWIRRGRFRAYVIALVIVAIAYVTSQIQGIYRMVGLEQVELEWEQISDPRDNTMFSHSLFVFRNIPDQHPHFFNRFPGHGAIVAIPQAVFYFTIGPIPRAIWNSKPIQPAMEWASKERSGVVTDVTWTGISSGIAGSWYATTGVLGMIQGAILWGWLIGCFDRVLWMTRNKPLILLVGLTFHATMFRTFRDPDYNLFYPLLIGLAALWVLSRLVEKQTDRLPDPYAPTPYPQYAY